MSIVSRGTGGSGTDVESSEPQDASGKEVGSQPSREK